MKASSLRFSLSHQICIGLIALSQIVLINGAYAQVAPPAQTVKPVEARQKMSQNADRLSKARKQLQAAFPKHRQNIKDKAARAKLVRHLKKCEQEHMEAVRERAELKGLEFKGDTPNGGNFLLIDFDRNDQPVYEETQNADAAITTATNEVRDSTIYQQHSSTQVEAEEAFPDNHDGIRVETTTDIGGGQNIGFIVNGDWAEYTIDVPVPGSYQLSFRTASNNNNGGAINLSANGTSIGSVVVPDTNGWQVWRTISTSVVFATSGPQTLRLDFAGGRGSLFNVNWFTYREAPEKVEAEVAFPDNQSGIQLEATTDSGGGQNIGLIVNGDWAEYTIDIPVVGQYRLDFRVASNSGGSIELSTNGVSLGSIDVANTGGWQTWKTIRTSVGFATAGIQTLRMDFVGGSGSLFNLNWFTYNRSVLIGQWESGTARLTHQELEGKVSVWDSSSTSTTNHATHVAGIMVSRGINLDTLGMAPEASIAAFSSQGGAESEMLANGSAEANTTGIQLSNHSYGVGRGWREDNGVWFFRGEFSDDGDPSNDYQDDFGRYSTRSMQWDFISYDLPYYLIFTSAGNQRIDDAPEEGEEWFLGNKSLIYDSSLHPLSNRDYKDGWDLMEGGTLAKNAIAVGASDDGVDSNGNRDLNEAEAGFFSSRGPADDGRIKPDIHGNGINLRSSTSSNDTSTGNSTGTSMSSPNVCGSAALLISYYSSRFSGQAMRASTLKALILHTADDRGVPGPDYSYGWGVMNTQTAVEVIKQHADNNGGALMLESTVNDSTHVSRTHSLRSDGTTPLRVTLCWTDPAGVEKSIHDDRAKDLVNDLNLKITGPDGTHYPYVMPYVGDWSLAKIDDAAITGVNDVDPIEQVYLVAPVAGDYTITVDYVGSLTDNLQNYSLVVTGETAAEIEVEYDGPPVTVLTDNSGIQNFGTTAPSEDSVARAYTVRNAGGGLLTGLEITTSGSHKDDFTVGSLSSTELAAGQTASFTVTYNPLGTGTRTAALQLSSGNGNESTFDINLLATGLSELEAWRLTNFNTIESTGNFADNLDFDQDGAPNLTEFLFATDPTKSDSGPITITSDTTTAELFYTRNVNAMADYTFQVVWADDLAQEVWFTSSEAEGILSDDGSVQQVKITVPVGTSSKRFFRVQVSPK